MGDFGVGEGFREESGADGTAAERHGGLGVGVEDFPMAGLTGLSADPLGSGGEQQRGGWWIPCIVAECDVERVAQPRHNLQMAATRSLLVADLTQLGILPGAVLMVHASVRSVGPVVGGVNVIVQALLEAIGPTGTLLAYVDFEPFYEDEDIEEADIPVFDKAIAHAARDHGVLHETLRNWPGAIRSDHPDAGVVAIGALAEWLTEDHPFQYGYGEGSPFEKAIQAGVQVLMLGAPLDTVTLLHFAEHKARIPDKRIHRYRRLMPGANGPQWTEFEEFDTGDPVHDALPNNCFELIVTAYLTTGRGTAGVFGSATATLLEGASLVAYGIEWLERYFASEQEKGDRLS